MGQRDTKERLKTTTRRPRPSKARHYFIEPLTDEAKNILQKRFGQYLRVWCEHEHLSLRNHEVFRLDGEEEKNKQLIFALLEENYWQDFKAYFKIGAGTKGFLKLVTKTNLAISQ